MKKRILGVLFAGILAASALSPMTAMADGQKVVTLGADLSEDQRNAVLKYFGILGQDIETIYVTNQDERNHLGSYVPLEQIGTHTYSCALVNPTTSGGIQVKTANLTWVTGNMIASTLSTSGVVNCEVLAASPFEVSGTGALTGILMAYETASGTTLDQSKKDLATQELVTTGTIANQVGQTDATAIVNEIKIQVIENQVEDPSQVQQIVDDVVDEYTPQTVELSDEDRQLLTDLADAIAQQDYDYSEMADTLQRVENNVTNTTNNTTNNTTTNITNNTVTNNTTTNTDNSTTDNSTTDNSATDNSVTDNSVTDNSTTDNSVSEDSQLPADSILNQADPSALSADGTGDDVVTSTTTEPETQTEAATEQSTEEMASTDGNASSIDGFTFNDTGSYSSDATTDQSTDAPAAETPETTAATEAADSSDGLNITTTDEYNSGDGTAADASADAAAADGSADVPADGYTDGTAETSADTGADSYADGSADAYTDGSADSADSTDVSAETTDTTEQAAGLTIDPDTQVAFLLDSYDDQDNQVGLFGQTVINLNIGYSDLTVSSGTLTITSDSGNTTTVDLTDPNVVKTGTAGQEQAQQDDSFDAGSGVTTLSIYVGDVFSSETYQNYTLTLNAQFTRTTDGAVFAPVSYEYNNDGDLATGDYLGVHIAAPTGTLNDYTVGAVLTGSIYLDTSLYSYADITSADGAVTVDPASFQAGEDGTVYTDFQATLNTAGIHELIVNYYDTDGNVAQSIACPVTIF